MRSSRAALPALDRAGLAAVAASAICFGSLGVFGKLAQRVGLGIPTLLGLRFGLAAVVLWLVAQRQGVRLWRGRRQSLGLAAMGLLYVGQAVAFFTSLRTVPAAITSILLYAYPVLVVLLARVLLGERLTAARCAALGLACAGVLMVVDPTPSGHLDAAGVGFGLASAVVYSTYIVAGPRLVGDTPAVVATAYICTVAGAVFLAAAAVSGSVDRVDARGWGVIAGIAVVPTLLAATLFLAGLARVGPSRAAIVSTLEPVSTALLAGIFLGETLTSLRLAGGVVVLAAAVLVAVTGAATAPPPQVPPA